MKIQIQKTLRGSEIVSAILWCLHASSQFFKESASNVYIVSLKGGVAIILESALLVGFTEEYVASFQKSLTIFGIKSQLSSQVKSKGNQAVCIEINQ